MYLRHRPLAFWAWQSSFFFFFEFLPFVLCLSSGYAMRTASSPLSLQPSRCRSPCLCLRRLSGKRQTLLVGLLFASVLVCSHLAICWHFSPFQAALYCHRLTCACATCDQSSRAVLIVIAVICGSALEQRIVESVSANGAMPICAFFPHLRRSYNVTRALQGGVCGGKSASAAVFSCPHGARQSPGRV